MADINQVITLGIGTPAAIPQFLTFGLQTGSVWTPIDGSPGGIWSPVAAHGSSWAPVTEQATTWTEANEVSVWTPQGDSTDTWTVQ